MSRPLHVTHPAPVLMVQRGGRRERVRYLAVSTPVEPVEISPSEMRLAQEPDPEAPPAQGVERGGNLREALWEADGRLWTRATASPGGPGARPLGKAAVLAGLARGAIPSRWSGLERFLVATPLLAMLRFRDGDLPQGLHVGARELPPGRVSDEMVDEARTALRDLFADRLRFAGEEAFYAFEGIHHVMPREALPSLRGARPVVPGTPLGALPRNAVLRGSRDAVCLRVDRSAGPVADPRWRHVSARCGGDADLMTHVNEMPGRTVGLVGRMGAAGRDVGSEGLRRLAALGSIGAIGRPDARAALLDVREVAVRGIPRAADLHVMDGLMQVRNYVEGIGLAIVDGVMDAEDEMALSSL